MSLGISTEQSCGGHDEDRKPWVEFPMREIKKVVALALAWKLAGGISYRFHRLGQYGRYVTMEVPENMLLQTAQNDLDGLTDFLAAKIGGLEWDRLEPIEIIHRFRRWLARKKFIK